MDQRERPARQGRRDLARGAVQAVARDLAEPAGDASPQAGRRARRGRIRLGSGRRRCVADAPAAGHPRAERSRRHDQSHAGASRAARARSVSRRASRRARTPSASAIPCAARSPRCAPPAERFGERSGPLRLLVIGGSQGAARLNAVVPAALATIDAASRPLVIHQAGERHLAQAQELYAKHGVQADVRAFIDDMAEAYALGRSRRLPLRRAHGVRARRGGIAGDLRAVRCRGRRSPDAQREVPRRRAGRQCRSPKRELTPARLAEELQKLLRGGRAQARRDGDARALGRDHRCGRAARRCMRRGRGRCAMTDRMRRIHRIHFVGIGGSGMGGIAEVLLNLGYQVQGSDLKPNAVTQRLEQLGAQIMIGHAAENVGKADVLVVSSAVQPRQPGSGRGEGAAHSDRAARGDARRADALPLRDRGRRHARQDHDDQHGRVDPRRRRARSDVRHRRPAEERRQQRAPRHRQVPGRRGRRERCVVHAPAADDRDRHQRRQRSSRARTTATSSG